MKTIGLLGGMSWESTAHYYRLINQGIRRELGGLHSASMLINSVDFAPIEALQRSGDWPQMAALLSDAAKGLEQAGADFLMIGTNTMHKVAEQVATAISIPLLHIADATGEAMVANGISCVGLLGTAFTMEQAFYRQRLEQRHGLKVLIPEQSERQRVHQVIYEELCRGIIRAPSRSAYLEIIHGLQAKGAQGVILGCTEIGLLVGPNDTRVPLFDTTAIHAERAVSWALSGESFNNL